MVLASKTRLGKRKLEVQEVRKEKQTLTSKKHDKHCLSKEENPEKEALFLQIKSLEHKIEDLVKEKVESEAQIEDLKRKIASKEADNATKDTQSIETQTESEFQDYHCKLCIYVASCVEELDWHFGDAHDDDDDETKESEVNSQFTCNICGRINRSKGELMIHRKNNHSQTVKTCKYFIEGKCQIPEDDCCFKHTVGVSSSQRSLHEFKCGFCGKSFNIKNDFMKHRRKDHPEIVTSCRDSSSCRFGPSRCWFIHDNSEENNQLESSDMIRLFEMMEKFGDRIKFIENQL